MTITATGYIVCDNEAIHGVGETADAAWSDFEQTMREAGIKIVEHAPEDDYSGSWAKAGDYRVQSATAALIGKVLDGGGNVAWEVTGGVACTIEEYEAP